MRSDAIAGAVRSLAWRYKSTWILEVPEVDVSTSGPSTAARPQGGGLGPLRECQAVGCEGLRTETERHNILRFEELPGRPATTTCRIAGVAYQGRRRPGRVGERLRIQNPDVEIRMFRSRQTKQGWISWVEACGSGIRNSQALSGETGGLRVSQKQDVTVEAAAVLHLALRAVLLSGQAQCLDRGKRTAQASPRVLQAAGPEKVQQSASYGLVFRPKGPKFAL